MTALMETARKMLGRGDDLAGRVEALGEVVAAARGRLDPACLDDAEAVVRRAGERLSLSSRHTVVSLAGATGSGKSSTFNALTGLDLSAVGVRRPTTSTATACVWGEQGAAEVLEWLGIPPRHRVMRNSMLDTTDGGELDGLILLDLPDHDSTEVRHHVEVERLVALADLMVWVLDPQKYADAAVHDRFLKPMADKRDVMLVTVNHIDEVPEPRRAGLLDDVHRVLVADGLDGITVIATSARTGEGIEELRARIAKLVAGKAAARSRLTSDVRTAAERVAAESGGAKPPRIDDGGSAELLDAIADSAGVPIVVNAVRKATSIRARRATGWPLVSWISRFRPDPLKRLHLDLGSSGKDLVAASRSSLPPATKVQHARVESTIRALSDEVSKDLSVPWQRAVRHASTSRFADLEDGLDRAVGGTDLSFTKLPAWCSLVRAVQWLLLVATIGGGLWLGALAGMSYLRLPELDTPEYRGIPVPTLLLAVGVAGGIVLAVLSRFLVSLAARSRARKADRRLRAGVAEVAQELVVEPMKAELDAYRTTYESLKRARG